METGKSYHMRVNIDANLKKSLKQFDQDWRNVCTDDKGRTMTTSEVYTYFIMEAAKGHKYIPLGVCNNFDPMIGCKGHTEEEYKALEGE